MGYYLLLFLGLVLIVVLIWPKGRNKIARTAVGICNTAVDRIVRKNANKKKILALLGERGELSNSDIRDELGVSGRTAVRYMNELEKGGKVEQIGDTGKYTHYKLSKILTRQSIGVLE